MKEHSNQTPERDLMIAALRHYEEASAAIQRWNSSIPKAIRRYYEPKHLASDDEILEGMVKLYASADVFGRSLIAEICDEVLDRTGMFLGKVRRGVHGDVEKEDKERTCSTCGGDEFTMDLTGPEPTLICGNCKAICGWFVVVDKKP